MYDSARPVLAQEAHRQLLSKGRAAMSLIIKACLSMYNRQSSDHADIVNIFRSLFAHIIRPDIDYEFDMYCDFNRFFDDFTHAGALCWHTCDITTLTSTLTFAGGDMSDYWLSSAYGLCQPNKRDFASAAKILKKGIEAEPGKLSYHIVLAYVYEELQQHKAAVESYRRWLRLCDQDSEDQSFIFLCLLRAYGKANDIDEAIQFLESDEYSHLSNLEQGNRFISFWQFPLIKAEIYLKAKRYGDVIHCLEAVPVPDRTDQTWELLSQAYAKTWGQSESIQLYATIVKDHPENTTVAELLACAYDEIGNREQALAVYEMLAQRNSNRHYAQIQLARLYRKYGMEDMAMGIYKKMSLAKEANDRRAGYMGMAEVMLNRQKFEDALSMYYKIEQLVEDEKWFNVCVQEEIGGILWIMGKWQEAAKAFAIAIDRSFDPTNGLTRIWKKWLKALVKCYSRDDVVKIYLMRALQYEYSWFFDYILKCLKSEGVISNVSDEINSDEVDDED